MNISIFNIVGVNFKTLEISKRESFSKLAPELIIKKVLSKGNNVELACVSTCNRFELITAGENINDKLLFFLREILPDLLEDSVYIYTGEEAVRHIMRVSAGLDSMVVGESQILAQLKETYTKYCRLKTVGKHLHKLFQFTFRTAKRARNISKIGDNPVSVSYIAVKAVCQIFEHIREIETLVIGAGEVAELTLINMKQEGLKNITVANRSKDNGAILAQRHGARFVALAEALSNLGDFDLIITSTASEQPLFTKRDLRRLNRKAPLVILDLGVPRNVPDNVHDVEGVYLFNIDDLNNIAEANNRMRLDNAREAEIAIEYGIFMFKEWLRKDNNSVYIRRLRGIIERACDEVVSREISNIFSTQGNDKLSFEARRLIKTVRQRLVHKLHRKISHHLQNSLFTELSDDITDLYFEVINSGLK